MVTRQIKYIGKTGKKEHIDVNKGEIIYRSPSSSRSERFTSAVIVFPQVMAVLLRRGVSIFNILHRPYSRGVPLR
jgi:hypothetical protein